MNPSRLFVSLVVFLLLLSTMPVAAEPMKLVYYDNYAPRSYSSEGKMVGIIIEIIDEAIKNRLGIAVTHEGYPWARAQEMVKRGYADAFVTVPTTERKEYTFVSKEPIFKFETFIATRANHPQLDQLRTVTSTQGLKNFKIVDYLGNGWAKNVLKDFKVYWLPGYKAIFPFLVQGKADVIILSKVGIHSISELGYQNEIIVLPQAVTSIGFSLCINKTSKFKGILEVFDEEIRKMRQEGVITEIIDRYYK
jgi:polar amino acid transport system substrate-binding protein